jgi:glucokinase
VTETIIGIDVGGTKTAVVEGTRTGAILGRTERLTEGARPFAETAPALLGAVSVAVAASRAAGRRPVAISVAVAGPVRARDGVLLNPPNLVGWHDLDLAAALSRAAPELPVYVEHDAKAGALAEYRFGVGATRAGLTGLVFLTFGTGMGAGIIVDRRLVRGASDAAGELWGLRLAPDDACRVRDGGQWEDVASGRGVARLAATLYPARWPAGTPIAAVVGAAMAGDGEALEVVAESGRWLGVGLAVLVDLLNPPLIVIGTLGVVLGERLLAPARAVLARRALPASVAACEVTQGALGARLGDVQSLMAAIERLG